MNSESEIRSDHSDAPALPLYFVKTLAGFEGFLEKELISLGGMQVEQAKRGLNSKQIWQRCFGCACAADLP